METDLPTFAIQAFEYSILNTGVIRMGLAFYWNGTLVAEMGG